MTRYFVVYIDPISDGVAIVVPNYTIEQTPEHVANLAVPAGLPYKIVPEADMPSDWSMRDAWTIDPAMLDSGVSAGRGHV